MAGSIADQLALRLRELLSQERTIVGGTEGRQFSDQSSEDARATKLWNAAAALTTPTSVMEQQGNTNGSSAHAGNFSQAILDVLQGIRPRQPHHNGSSFFPKSNWVTEPFNPSAPWNADNWTFPDLDLTSFMDSGDGGGPEGSNSHYRPGLRTAIIATAYALVMAISLFGNLLVCYVVIRHRRLRSVTYTFLVNVALSDLLMTCLNIPFSVSRVLLDHWPFGDFLCSLVPFVQVLSVYVSSLTMAAIAVDRYRVILTPLKRRLRPPHGLVIMLFLWLLASVAALPYALYSEVVPIFTYRQLRRCQARFPTPALEFRRYLTLITFATQYVIPLGVSGLAYGAIVRKLWLRSVVGAVTDNQRHRQERAKRKTIQMLLVVVSLFALCWLPLNVYHLVSDVGASVSASRHNSTAFLVCHWLAMSSVCYNPFVYCWLNKNFRDAVKTCGRLCLRSVWFKQSRKQQPSLILHNTTAAHPESTSNTTGLSVRQPQDSVQSAAILINQLPHLANQLPINEETSLM